MESECRTMHARTVVLTAAIVMAPIGARGADLVVCWQQSFCAPRCAALGQIVAAFEQEIGNGPDCRPMDLENDVAKAIVVARDAKRRLFSSIRSHQAKVASGRDDDDDKGFFDYEAAALAKESSDCFGSSDYHQSLGGAWLYAERDRADPASHSSWLIWRQACPGESQASPGTTGHACPKLRRRRDPRRTPPVDPDCSLSEQQGGCIRCAPCA
jgi:hypothetical protein